MPRSVEVSVDARDAMYPNSGGEKKTGVHVISCRKLELSGFWLFLGGVILAAFEKKEVRMESLRTVLASMITAESPVWGARWRAIRCRLCCNAL